MWLWGGRGVGGSLRGGGDGADSTGALSRTCFLESSEGVGPAEQSSFEELLQEEVGVERAK